MLFFEYCISNSYISNFYISSAYISRAMGLKPTMSDYISVEYHLVASTDSVNRMVSGHLATKEFRLKEYEFGADREQWFIEWQSELLVLCVEHLSESAWLMPIGQIAPERLQNIHQLLFCHST